MMRKLLGAIVVLGALGLTSGALAQDGGECRTVRRGSETVVECGDTLLRGRVQRPLSIIIPRAQIRWEPPPLRDRRHEIVRTTRNRAL
jgi:hypothetical protein